MSLVKKKQTRTRFLRLREPAALSVRIECGTCLIEVEPDPDGITCPSCGTEWMHYHGDGDTGEIEPGNWDDDQFEETITEEEDAYRRGKEVQDHYVFESES